MLVFLDESGDSGMRDRSGSSAYFIVTAVLFEDHEEAEACDKRIAELRDELGKRENFEFHFNSCSNALRLRFLTAVSHFDFFYHSVVLDKSRLWNKGFHDKESFYKYAAGLVFENAKPQLIQSKVVFDKCGNRDFRKQLRKYLQRRMNDSRRILIKRVAMEASHTNGLLQLADMICGAVARSFTSKGNRLEFRRIVEHRELRVQVWPK